MITPHNFIFTNLTLLKEYYPGYTIFRTRNESEEPSYYFYDSDHYEIEDEDLVDFLGETRLFINGRLCPIKMSNKDAIEEIISLFLGFFYNDYDGEIKISFDDLSIICLMPSCGKNVEVLF